MTEIPPDLASSAAQSGYMAREVAKEREAQRAGNREAAQQSIKAVKEADETVDAEDADTAIFADAEGAGSQGRTETEPEEPTTENDADDADERGITRDDDGQLHLDIEA